MLRNKAKSAGESAFAIQAQKITKRFGEEVLAVDALDLSILRNTTYALLGPNGAGKTTAVSILTTLAEPTSGTAWVNGFNVVNQANQVRRQIGVTFQEMILDDALTGRQVLDYHGRLYGLSSSQRRARNDELLELVELSRHADRRCKEYSGGMKRRLELARALVTVPRVLFFDEPTLGLDPQGRAKIWDYIQQLKNTAELTVLLTTHYLDEAERLADVVGIMDRGRLVIEGEPSSLIDGLGADTIRLLGSGSTEALAGRLSEKAFVQSVSKVDQGLLIGVESSSRHLAEVITTASACGLTVEDVSIAKPDLGAVFFKYTGRELPGETRS